MYDNTIHAVDTRDGDENDLAKILELAFMDNRPYICNPNPEKFRRIRDELTDLKPESPYSQFPIKLLFGLQSHGIIVWIYHIGTVIDEDPAFKENQALKIVLKIMAKVLMISDNDEDDDIPDYSLYNDYSNGFLQLVNNSFGEGLDIGNAIVTKKIEILRDAIAITSSCGYSHEPTIKGTNFERKSGVLQRDNIQESLMKGNNITTGGKDGRYPPMKDRRTKDEKVKRYNAYLAAVYRLSTVPYNKYRDKTINEFIVLIMTQVRVTVNVENITEKKITNLESLLKRLSDIEIPEIDPTNKTIIDYETGPTFYGGGGKDKRELSKTYYDLIEKFLNNSIRNAINKYAEYNANTVKRLFANIKAPPRYIPPQGIGEEDVEGGPPPSPQHGADYVPPPTPQPSPQHGPQHGPHIPPPIPPPDGGTKRYNKHLLHSSGRHDSSLLNKSIKFINPIKKFFGIKGGGLYDCLSSTGHSLRGIIYAPNKQEYLEGFYITNMQASMSNLSELIQSRSFSETIDITTSNLVSDIQLDCINRAKDSNDTLIQGMIIFNELNINPINVHAMQRFIPFANIYNYSQSFDNFMFNTFNIPMNSSRKVFEKMNELDLYGMLTQGGYDDVTINVKKDYDTVISLTMIKMLSNPYVIVTPDEYGINSDYSAAIYGPVCRILRGHGGLGMGTPKFLSDNVLNKALLGSMYIGTKLGTTYGSNMRYGSDSGDVSRYNVRGGGGDEDDEGGNKEFNDYAIDGYSQNYDNDNANDKYNFRKTSGEDNSDIIEIISWYSNKDKTVVSANLSNIFPGSSHKILDFRMEGYERFNTQLIRNVIFISNLQRVMRMTINKWMTKLYKLVQTSNRSTIAEVTERRIGEELGPASDEDYDIPTWM